jgi:hypothetical protein
LSAPAARVCSWRPQGDPPYQLAFFIVRAKGKTKKIIFNFLIETTFFAMPLQWILKRMHQKTKFA